LRRVIGWAWASSLRLVPAALTLLIRRWVPEVAALAGEDGQA